MTSKRASSHRRPAVVPPQVVRAAIARAVRGQHAQEATASATLDTPVLGDVTLLPHQRDAITRLRVILAREHVALLADDVGTGKTFTALGVARTYARTLVITPAALMPMWQQAITRTGSANIDVRSMQAYSRVLAGVYDDASTRDNAPPPPTTQPADAVRATATLVIIDEAHHFRTPSTKRYRAVADACSGCDLLLMSATPIHNSAADLRAVFALARGANGDLHGATLARLTVRRRGVVANTSSTSSARVARPTVSVQPHIPVPHDPRLLELILALPSPLPAQDGAVAGALIRLGLLRAWCSSDAALAATIRRRLLRGEALLQALRAGRHPTAAELRSWLVGEHEVQLAFPELLASTSVESAPLLEVLERHLEALAGLLDQQRGDHRADAARAAALRHIMHAHPETPVVAFSQFAETVRAISRALTDIAGVGTLTGRHGWIASGPISRAETLAHFAPVAQGRPPPPAHQRIRLLLATDLLAEGVNLQDAGVVVHLDLPWTDALRQQRVGRCARVGSPHDVVTVYSMQPPETADRVLQLGARLARKARVGARVVGRVSPVEAAECLRVVLGGWGEGVGVRGAVTSGVSGRRASVAGGVSAAAGASIAGDVLRAGGLQVAGVPARQHGFLAVCHTRSGVREVLGGWRVTAPDGRVRWRLSRAPGALLRLATSVAGESLASSSVVRQQWLGVSRALARWLDREGVAADVGDRDRLRSRVHRAARQRLQQWLRRVPPSQRVIERARVRAAEVMLECARGVGAEAALEAWVAAYPGRDASVTAWREWPDRWRAYSVLARGVTVSSAGAANAEACDRSDADAGAREQPDLPRIEHVLLLIDGD